MFLAARFLYFNLLFASRKAPQYSGSEKESSMSLDTLNFWVKLAFKRLLICGSRISLLNLRREIDEDTFLPTLRETQFRQELLSRKKGGEEIEDKHEMNGKLLVQVLETYDVGREYTNRPGQIRLRPPGLSVGGQVHENVFCGERRGICSGCWSPQCKPHLRIRSYGGCHRRKSISMLTSCYFRQVGERSFVEKSYALVVLGKTLL